jgi:hypothetical protein
VRHIYHSGLAAVKIAEMNFDFATDTRMIAMVGTGAFEFVRGGETLMLEEVMAELAG